MQRLSAIRSTRDAQFKAKSGLSGLPITIGGDCGVELGAIEFLARSNESMAVVWFDAHPDLNTPESSPTGAFTGMVLRTLLGDGHGDLVPTKPLSPELVILVGTRNLDDGESEFVNSTPIALLESERADAAALVEALTASGATSVYLHIDVDVLDPSELTGVGDPMPFGISLQVLLESIAAAKATLPLVGAGITGFAPASEDAAADDLATILRIVSAITR